MRSLMLLRSALVAALVAVATSPAAAAVPTTGHATATAASHALPERHPAIRAAIRSLEKAKTEMQHANHDFGGHRVDAIAAVDNALAQLRLALQYDSK